MKITYDYRLAFAAEKALIAAHPEALYVRVDARPSGLVATVEEKDGPIDVSQELVAFVNHKLSLVV